MFEEIIKISLMLIEQIKMPLIYLFILIMTITFIIYENRKLMLSILILFIGLILGLIITL